jgi:hypothetical protein
MSTGIRDLPWLREAFDHHREHGEHGEEAEKFEIGSMKDEFDVPSWVLFILVARRDFRGEPQTI